MAESFEELRQRLLAKHQNKAGGNGVPGEPATGGEPAFHETAAPPSNVTPGAGTDEPGHHATIPPVSPSPSTSQSQSAAAGDEAPHIIPPSQTSGVPPPADRPKGRLAYALAYARYGMRVFPCHHIESDRECSCGKLKCASAGKHPRNKGWQAEATTDEEQIRRWWTEQPLDNIGVKCGQDSNLTVLDVDGDVGRDTLREMELENGELPETPVAMTGSGLGRHYAFQYEPGIRNAVKFAPGLDIRTEGGLIVGVGSATKQRYEWEAIAPLSANLLPSKMPGWLIGKVIEGQGGSNGTSTNGFKASETPIREGEGRNNYLYRMGRSLKAKQYPAAAIKVALEACNREQCVPPLAPDEFSLVLNQVLNQPDQPGFLLPAKRDERQEEKIKTFDLGGLYSMVDEFEGRPYVWDGILPHQTNGIIVGKSETGKSTIIYTLIYGVVTGGEVFGRPCEQGRVLYLAGDPGAAIVAGRVFRGLGLTDGIKIVDGALVAFKDGMAQLEALVKEFRPILIICDTLAATVNLDVDKYGDSYQAQQPLVRLAREYNCHVLMSHHSQKSQVDKYSVIDAALGSVGVAAVASARMGTKMYRRKGERFYTFEMSNLRIGRPIEGEFIVHKMPNGLVELGDMWKRRSIDMDKQNILDILDRQSEPMSKRTLWFEMRPKPSYDLFSDAIEELLVAHQIESLTMKGGQKFRRC